MMDLVSNHYVCPKCHHPFKISARERIRQLIDEGTFKETDAKMISVDPDDFPGYKDKLERLQKQTGMKEAVITGTGKIKGLPCVIGVMDSNFFMGSMSAAVGEKITRAIELATKKKLPLNFVLYKWRCQNAGRYLIFGANGKNFSRNEKA